MLRLVHVNKRHHHFPSQFSNTRSKEVVKLSFLYFEYTFERTVDWFFINKTKFSPSIFFESLKFETAHQNHTGLD